MAEQESLLVMRYERVTHHKLGAIEAHGRRLGDVEHVDATRTHLNEFSVGHEYLTEIANAHIVRMQRDNIDRKLASLRRRRRKSEARDLENAVDAAGDDPHALAEVVGWPWDSKNVMPFTEGLISVSHAWFLDADGNEDPAKIDAFRSFVLGYLQEEFGGEVIYARFDRDEKTPHFSFVIAPEHEERRTKRRMLSHRQHRLFGREEVFKLFDDDPIDPKQRRRSYEILQDRAADYAQSQGFDIARGARRAATERMQRALGESVTKRKNISPARGRELAAAMTGEATEDRDKAASDRAAAERDRTKAAEDRARTSAEAQDAEAARRAARAELRKARDERTALAAKEESMMIGAQAIIAEELAYAPPTPQEAEGLAWGRNRPDSEKRRNWLIEKIKPARDWLVGFARAVFGHQQERQAEQARQAARAQAIIDAEAHLDRAPPQAMRDIVETAEVPGAQIRSIPNAWAVPKDMTPEQIDRHLRAMTNTAICDAYGPTRDARDFAEHNGDLQARYGAGLHHLTHEAARRGVDPEQRTYRPEKATDPERAKLHTDAAPRAIRVVRPGRGRQRVRG